MVAKYYHCVVPTKFCLILWNGRKLFSKLLSGCCSFYTQESWLRQRGSAEAIQAANQAQAQNIQIYVVGVTTDGEEVDEIRQLASPSSCTNQNFFLTSNVNQLASILTDPLARKACGMQPQQTGSNTSFHFLPLRQHEFTSVHESIEFN